MSVDTDDDELRPHSDANVAATNLDTLEVSPAAAGIPNAPYWEPQHQCNCMLHATNNALQHKVLNAADMQTFRSEQQQHPDNGGLSCPLVSTPDPLGNYDINDLTRYTFIKSQGKMKLQQIGAHNGRMQHTWQQTLRAMGDSIYTLSGERNLDAAPALLLHWAPHQGIPPYGSVPHFVAAIQPRPGSWYIADSGRMNLNAHEPVTPRLLPLTHDQVAYGFTATIHCFMHTRSAQRAQQLPPFPTRADIIDTLAQRSAAVETASTI
jgi:hypothetical protein